MRMLSFLLLTFFYWEAWAQETNRQESFLVLGDMHYDRLDDHDLEWLCETKPGDFKQVQSYSRYTEENWIDFTTLLRKQVLSYLPPIKAVIQLGDLSEGFAGNVEKAEQMAGNVIKAVEEINMPVPWIVIKGNHDITGPGAKEAFNNHYIPFFRKQLNNEHISSANYSYTIGNKLFVCLDPWDKETDILTFLENTLSGSDARHKFVLIHEPVIPVNERCWHVLRREPDKRQNLLNLLGKHSAIVLSAHLHLYSVVKRQTEYGPVIQIGVNSVIKNRNHIQPKKVITEYGSILATDKPDWEPKSLQQRVEWLEQETPFVSFYKQMDLPGYGILVIDNVTQEVKFEYYAAFSNTPYDTLSITRLLKQNSNNKIEI